MTFFNQETKQIIDGSLENFLYKKCAEIILKRLNPQTRYVVVGKSAGGGVALYLGNMMKIDQLFRLLLFAPGAEYVSEDDEFTLKVDRDKIKVGWNKEDSKVPIDKVWAKLSTKMQRIDPEVFSMDGDKDKTEHEINSNFITYIKLEQ